MCVHRNDFSYERNGIDISVYINISDASLDERSFLFLITVAL